MASRIFDSVSALHKRMVVLGGLVTLGGSAEVSTSAGLGYTVARTGVGLYTITLTDLYPEILHVSATALKSSAALSFYEIVSITESTGVIVIRHVQEAAGTLAAADPASGDKFTLMILAQNSSAN